MAKQLIGIVSSCAESGICSVPGACPAAGTPLFVSKGWVSLSCCLFFCLYLCWWKQSADAGVISMKVWRSGGNLHVLIKDGFSHPKIILSLFWPCHWHHFLEERCVELLGLGCPSECESWVAQTDSRAQISSFLGWDSGQTLPTGALPAWACLVCLEGDLLISFDLRRVQIPLFPLLYAHQLEEVWITRTRAPVWVRAVSQLSCAAWLWLLTSLCLLFSCTSSACCPSRSYKCHSRWLGEAVSVITAARFPEAWLCTKNAFSSPPRDSKLSVLQMQIWSFQGNTMEEMCDLRAGSKAACLSSWHNSYHASVLALFSLLLLGQLSCSW